MELKQQKPNYFLYWAVFCVNLVCINTACTYSWASPSIPKLKSNDSSINPLGRPITSSEESLMASLGTLGSIPGTIIAGAIAGEFGRKRTLIVLSIPTFIGYVIIANAREVVYIYVSRCLMGVSAGSVLSVLPSYVGEISEDSNRGTLGSVFGIMNCIGHVLSFVVGPLVSMQTFAYILMVSIVLFFTTFVPFIPESPYYYLSKNNIKEARKSLQKLRPNKDITQELIYMTDIVKESKENKVSFKDVITSRSTRRGLVIVCGLLLLQQALGISIILFYLQPILEASGNIIPSYIASMIIGIVQLITCCVVSVVVDRIGKKFLLHFSSAGTSLSLFALGTFFILKENSYNLDSVFWLPVASLITYYIFFNFGFSIIPWILCGEIFPSNVKSVCTSFATCVGIISSFWIGFFFPYLRDAFGMGTVFYVCVALGALSSVFVSLFVPETKGKSFHEIQYDLKKC